MNYRHVEGWFDFEDVYREAICQGHDGDTYVEIGAWLGRSTAYMAEGIRATGKRISFFTIDTFTGNTTPTSQQVVHRHGGSVFDQFKANMKAIGVDSYVTPVVADSITAATRFPDQSVSFVFIDADHAYHAVKNDITTWLPKVRIGGTLAGHDIDLPDVRRAVGELLPDATVNGRSWVWKKRTR